MPPEPDGPVTLAAALATLDHPGARRRFRVAPAGGPADDGWVTAAGLLSPAGRAARDAADPVVGLGIVELTGSMSFHASAVAFVDLVASLLVVAQATVALDPERIWARVEGAAVVEVLLDEGLALEPADVDRLADRLVRLLEPVVLAVEPRDAALRWGAVADLVAVIGLGRQRASEAAGGPTADEAWDRIASLVAALARLRVLPAGGPVRLGVPVDGEVLTLVQRSSCCQWYRAARVLGDASVTDARCADCPALDPASSIARLAVSAAAGELGAP
ncbi:hypothetical protein BH10ACT1_BH10ACT1_19390 [soil metagenome]